MAPNPKPVPPPAPALAALATLPPAAPPAAPTPFPTAACGPQLEAAITAVAARTQAPPELIAHHLLTLAAMAAQRLISVRLPTGPTQPVSCYFLTIAGSGEGRSAAESMCVGPVRFWERRFTPAATQLRPENDPTLEPINVSLGFIPDFVAYCPASAGSAKSAPGAAKSAKAPRPFEYDQVFLSPTRAAVNDRYDRYARFGRRAGLFATVAANLLTPSSARRNEAGSLSALWDGGIVVDGIEGAAVAPRLSVHLVAAPGEGRALLRAPEVADSGLRGRVLAAQPASRIGARVFSESDGAAPPALAALHAALTALYEGEATCESRIIALDDDAKRMWFAFAHEAEAAMAPEGAFAPIRPLAGRLAEHALRLAAIVAFIENDSLTEITPHHLARGVELARYYAAEALRLAQLRGPARAETDLLAALQAWLTRKHAGAEVSLRDVYCFGPPELRSAPLALRAMRQLEMLGFAEAVKAAGAAPKGLRWRLVAAGESANLQPTAA